MIIIAIFSNFFVHVYVLCGIPYVLMVQFFLNRKFSQRVFEIILTHLFLPTFVERVNLHGDVSILLKVVCLCGKTPSVDEERKRRGEI